MNIFRKAFVELRYYLFKIVLPFPKVLSKEATLELLITSQKSLARYGDGEFHMLGKSESLGFQTINDSLSTRLKEILSSDNSECLISLPIGLQSVKGFNAVGDYFWKQFIVFHYRRYISFIDLNKIYCNTNVTRPYIDYVNPKDIASYFSRMQDLWRDKKVLIVEGEMSRLGVGNDLFSTAQSIDRILTLSKNAYSLYAELLKACEAVIGNYDLVLISLGPTATVLTYDLSKYGVQVIDIGHIDLEYEWFLKGVKEKVPIPGKHVNEISYEINFEPELDPVYLKQIIGRVTN